MYITKFNYNICLTDEKQIDCKLEELGKNNKEWNH